MIWSSSSKVTEDERTPWVSANSHSSLLACPSALPIMGMAWDVDFILPTANVFVLHLHVVSFVCYSVYAVAVIKFIGSGCS